MKGLKLARTIYIDEAIFMEEMRRAAAEERWARRDG